MFAIPYKLIVNYLSGKRQSNDKSAIVFLVGDDRPFRNRMKSELERDKNNTVHVFKTGDACLEMVENLVPDLVLLKYPLQQTYSFARNVETIIDQITLLSPQTYVFRVPE